jgi:hypothetical protein
MLAAVEELGYRNAGLIGDAAVLDIPYQSNHILNACHPERSATTMCPFLKVMGAQSKDPEELSKPPC